MFWDEDVFEELDRMRKRIERMMRTMSPPDMDTSFPIDVSETEDEVIVKADLPGFKKDEITVRASENSLEIEAEHKEVKEEKKGKMYRSERKYGKLYRAIPLPTPVKFEEAKAKIENGVLTVTLPKKEKAKKKIEIE